MQCNFIAPLFMTDIVDAIEAARTILLAINKSWAGKQGEFLSESPMNLLAAVIWFLRPMRMDSIAHFHIVSIIAATVKIIPRPAKPVRGNQEPD